MQARFGIPGLLRVPMEQLMRIDGKSVHCGDTRQTDMLGRFVMLAHEKTSRGGDALVKEIHWLAWPIRVALCRSVCAGITYWVGYFCQPAVRPLVKVAGAGDSSCRCVWPVWVTFLRRFCMQIPSFENPFGVASNVEIN